MSQCAFGHRHAVGIIITPDSLIRLLLSNRTGIAAVR